MLNEIGPTRVKKEKKKRKKEGEEKINQVMLGYVRFNDPIIWEEEKKRRERKG